MVTTLNDDVNFMLSPARSEVANASFRTLRVDAHAECHQGFEELPKERAITMPRHRRRLCSEKRLPFNPEQTGGEGWIYQMMLRGQPGATQMIPRGLPRWNRL